MDGRSWVAVGLTVVGLGCLAAPPAAAQGRSLLVPIGEPVFQQGLRVTAGYVPGHVGVDPPGPATDGLLVLHLQLEVDAVRGNPYGLDAEDSVPYLRLPFQLVHETASRRVDGMLMPMVSRNGFHYGATVGLPVAGAWTLSVEIRPPEGLARHTDPRTGVAAWWTPFTLTWTLRPER